MTPERKLQLQQRTVEIIRRGGRILLKNNHNWYLGCWTNIASGPDAVSWSLAKSALEMFNLEWAFAIAPLYNCTVVVRYERKRRSQEFIFSSIEEVLDELTEMVAVAKKNSQ